MDKYRVVKYIHSNNKILYGIEKKGLFSWRKMGKSYYTYFVPYLTDSEQEAKNKLTEIIDEHSKVTRKEYLYV